MEIQGTTRVFAILGDPVAHSLSPLMQNAAFRALGLDAVYVPIRCGAHELEALMRSLAMQGGGGNITIPHKVAAAAALARDPAAPGPICNTFWGREGRLEGAETDSEAIRRTLAGMGADGGGWLLLGTGGSARAALIAAKRAGARIAVRSRSAERAAQFEGLARSEGLQIAQPDDCAVILNCTPLGLGETDPSPLDPSVAPDNCTVLDLVYRRGETAWVRAMRTAGCVAADGREVLVEQGAAAFELWFPGRVAPREVMRAAVRAALE